MTKCQYYLIGNLGEETKKEYVIEITDIHSMKVIEESCIILLSSTENKIVEFNPDVEEMEEVVNDLDLQESEKIERPFIWSPAWGTLV